MVCTKLHFVILHFVVFSFFFVFLSDNVAAAQTSVNRCNIDINNKNKRGLVLAKTNNTKKTIEIRNYSSKHLINASNEILQHDDCLGLGPHDEHIELFSPSDGNTQYFISSDCNNCDIDHQRQIYQQSITYSMIFYNHC